MRFPSPTTILALTLPLLAGTWACGGNRELGQPAPPPTTPPEMTHALQAATSEMLSAPAAGTGEAVAPSDATATEAPATPAADAPAGPDGAVPDGAVPDGAVPDGAVPDGAAVPSDPTTPSPPTP